MHPEPAIIYKGMTLEWTRLSTNTTYLDSDGSPVHCLASEWVLKYKFAGPSGAFEITAAADGDDFVVSVTAATTDGYKVGEYSWVAVAEKGAGATLARRIIDRGTCQVKEGLAEYITGLDNRTHVKKTLDAIEAVIFGRATVDQLSYTIQGLSLQKTPMTDLIRFRQIYKAEYDAELAAEKISNGETAGRRYLARFSGTS